jgi:hypothetical protein
VSETSATYTVMSAGSTILSSTHQIGVTGGKMETRVTLRPGDKGTKRMVERFGERLICVRYRYDSVRKMRYKTVELIVEEAPWNPRAEIASESPPPRPPALVGVRVDFLETELRHTVKDAGGGWDPARKLWILPLRTARKLGLDDRVVAVPDSSPAGSAPVAQQPR